MVADFFNNIAMAPAPSNISQQKFWVSKDDGVTDPELVDWLVAIEIAISDSTSVFMSSDQSSGWLSANAIGIIPIAPYPTEYFQNDIEDKGSVESHNSEADLQQIKDLSQDDYLTEDDILTKKDQTTNVKQPSLWEV